MAHDALSQQVADAVAPLPAEYLPLLMSVTEVLGSDPRILAVFLGGSVGRMAADAGSDLDLLVTVSEADFEAVATDLPMMLADVVDPIIALPVPGMPGTVAYTTRRGLRLDVVLERIVDVHRSGARHRIVAFDRAHVSALVPSPMDLDGGPDPVAVAAIVQEFFRQQAMFPAVVARADWLLGQEGVHNARKMLYDVFVEANQPLPAMGVKQWSSRLTPDQRDVLARLRLPAADRSSVIDAMIAVRRSFRREGRAAVEVCGTTWPVELDEAVADQWRREGFDT